ncbi:MAG: acyltransferase [Lachnospiraceae bacterium]|nr:acyltransferase [Lachnospiraceae bacterium]
MKKERIYYLDLIKIIAVISVFVCHFSRSLEVNQVSYSLKILPDYIFNVYLGGFGVSLFFIISGAALMYVYDEKLELKTYYKKRFMGIYPMFWIAFLIAFSISLFRFKSLNPEVPKWKIIYSILGMDGNALWWGPNYYQLGEWFLSVIVCMYIVFPLIRWLLKKSVILTCVITLIIYVLCLLCFHTTLPLSCFFLARIPELLFGMIFIKFIKKVNGIQLIVSVIAVVVTSIIPFENINSTVATTVVGISSFSIFTWIFQHVPITELMKRLAEICGKYCYPFFLTHHYVLRWMTSNFTGCQLRKSEEIIVFFSCFAVVLLATRMLYQLHESIMAFVFNKKTK